MQTSKQLLKDIKNKFQTTLQAQNLAITNDERLLDYLLKLSPYKDEYKKRFFIEKSGALIFNKDEFIIFLDTELKGLGYTRFLNKIGLSNDNKFLKSNEKVVLNFPNKKIYFLCLIKETT